MCDIMYNYLPHPSNMRTTDAVLAMRIAEGAAGYGIYMMLLEMLRDAEGRSLTLNPAHLAFAINEPNTDLVSRVIQDYGLFTISEEGKFSSPWLEAAMDEYDQKKAAAREAGRRGAAKRYGKVTDQAPDMTKDENPEQAPYGDPIGGGMANPCPTNSNITLPDYTKQNITSPNPTKSKLLGLSCGKWSGEELFLIARQRGTYLSEIDKEEVACAMAVELAKPEAEYNPEMVYDAAVMMGLNHEQFTVLREITENGRIGSQTLHELGKIMRAWKSREFRPKYPFEYIVCKLLEI